MNVGTYTCVAETPTSKIVSETILNIKPFGDAYEERCLLKKQQQGSPARIYTWTSDQVERESAVVQLHCRASGYPAPHFVWLDPQRKLIGTGQSNYQLLPNGDLLIRAISWEENMGVYTCIAGNEIGEDSVNTFLYPYSQPESSQIYALFVPITKYLQRLFLTVRQFDGLTIDGSAVRRFDDIYEDAGISI
ncbi:neural/ectodermal development factor IMP-L2-like [Tubulanus polymorphus]|uniref:neural/ectodermal development factor IMP-L2-like n=1 Tax=Tubulanus polymorphus TaxID=672921 RepID=UPI003DA46B45